jgi:hypothetical protein
MVSNAVKPAQKRNQEFDVLRTLIILNAFLLHFNQKYDLGFLASPSVFFQKHIFSVGTFFFFTSGFMAHRFYLKKFTYAPGNAALKLVRKGFQILLIYLAYVTFMRLMLGDQLPLDPYEYIYNHGYFTKVLFAFSVMYIVSPAIIFSYVKSPKIFYAVLGLFFLSWILLRHHLPVQLGSTVTIGFLFGAGEKSVFYALVPTLIVYQLGFICSALSNRLTSKNHSGCPTEENDFNHGKKPFRNKLLAISGAILLGHTTLTIVSGRYAGISTRPEVFVVLSSIFVFLCIYIFQALLRKLTVAEWIQTKQLTIVGIESLTFYVLSNLFLGFTRLPANSHLSYKCIILATITALTWQIVTWSYSAKSLARMRHVSQ